jgi:hypothetical protein
MSGEAYSGRKRTEEVSAGRSGSGSGSGRGQEQCDWLAGGEGVASMAWFGMDAGCWMLDAGC